jgi:hypothetical protein
MKAADQFHIPAALRYEKDFLYPKYIRIDG